jgi:bifunctional non-homologous end joining protein LigD
LAPLEEYQKKRDFKRTPEPAGDGKPAAGAASSGDGVFVIHKHAARRLHYDLRLEHDGVLESWAVPKGPSLKPGEKRLAVKVEDHPLEYGDFEGVIPSGEYGAGTVMLWDRGRWRASKRSDGHLDFELEGHKLRGAWTLIRTSGGASGRNGQDKNDNWLLIKRRERRKQPPSELEALPEDASVATGRTMEQIAADRSRVWSGRSENGSAPAALPDPERLAGHVRARMPQSLQPQLATLTDKAPAGDDWIHEIKFDGYRILAHVEDGRVRLASRNGKDWTDRFPEMATLLANLPAAAALIDGEMVAMTSEGVSSFGHLQEALSSGRTAALYYQAFDLLHLDGFDLTAVGQLERKRALARLLETAGFVGSARIRYTDHIAGKGPEFYERACRLRLEGIICKRADARYTPGRNKHWLKVKCTRHEELVVGGYTEPAGARSGFGALLLGFYHEQRLTYAGRVGTGFSDRQLRALHRQLRAIEIADPPFDPAPAGRGVHWVKPELVAEVEFTEWTRDGLLRHPTFRGLREDKHPKEIVMERPTQTPAQPARTQPARAKPAGATAAQKKPLRAQATPEPDALEPRVAAAPDRVAGVRLTNPDRVLYPEQGITKLDLARYYEEIADWILPQLRGRPLSLLRCPQGRGQVCFFQKHPQQAMASHIPRVRIREKSGTKTYLYVQTVADLIALVQAGTLELHVWGSRVDDLERPDMVVFDLDPAPELSWAETVRTARDLRDRLGALGLETFVRTTGGKGLHVVTPLTPERDWEDVKAFSHGVARALAQDEPQRFTTNMSKAKRRGRIFLDYLRNGRGATAIASYSTRAREDAPVAVPVRWDELSGALSGDRYNVSNVRRRLTALRGDPWEDFDAARRPITATMLKAVGAQRSNA